jgi:alpha-methylacyl-CoA racemase
MISTGRPGLFPNLWCSARTVKIEGLWSRGDQGGSSKVSGPLTGYTVVELTGIGPGPFAGMVLSDMGAEVLRIDRAQSVSDSASRPVNDVLGRGRRSVGVDLKHPDGRATVLRLVERADALIEGFRPGVTERLGLGPDDCMARNPKLVYGRMTGWGQDGPAARTAGHDIDYISLSGALSLSGRVGERPLPPVNLLGDFGGGGMLLAFGVVCALLEAGRSGQGQVVDAAMVDGSALLTAMIWGFRAEGVWGERGTNVLDTGAWWYEVYETSDGGYLGFGSIEPQFYAEMLSITGLGDDVDGKGPLPEQWDRSTWPGMKDRLAAVVRTRTRDDWVAAFDGTDACVSPVLDLDEAPCHPHNAARGTFVERDGVMQPAPAPRFSRTVPEIAGPPASAGEHTDEVLTDWGFSGEEIAALRDGGAVR